MIWVYSVCSGLSAQYLGLLWYNFKLAILDRLYSRVKAIWNCVHVFSKPQRPCSELQYRLICMLCNVYYSACRVKDFLYTLPCHCSGELCFTMWVSLYLSIHPFIHQHFIFALLSSFLWIFLKLWIRETLHFDIGEEWFGIKNWVISLNHNRVMTLGHFQNFTCIQ